MAKRWTIEELKYLEANYNEKSVQYIAEKLNRSIDAVHWKASQYNIKYRDRKTKKQKIKHLISFTPAHSKFLKKFNNKSLIIQKALAKYIQSEQRKKAR